MVSTVSVIIATTSFGNRLRVRLGLGLAVGCNEPYCLLGRLGLGLRDLAAKGPVGGDYQRNFEYSPDGWMKSPPGVQRFGVGLVHGPGGAR